MSAERRWRRPRLPPTLGVCRRFLGALYTLSQVDGLCGTPALSQVSSAIGLSVGFKAGSEGAFASGNPLQSSWPSAANEASVSKSGKRRHIGDLVRAYGS